MTTTQAPHSRPNSWLSSHLVLIKVDIFPCTILELLHICSHLYVYKVCVRMKFLIGEFEKWIDIPFQFKVYI